MIYLISDLHGMYNEYRQMLKKIEFGDDDVLYVLGDVVDRGPEPMKILQDMSMRSNVIPILGNHDYNAYEMLKELLLDFTEENIIKHFGNDLANFYQRFWSWLGIGGKSTIEGFGKMTPEERAYAIEYLSEFSLYETIAAKGKTYILTHSGLPEGATFDNLDQFDVFDFINASADYRRQYFNDVFLVTGHIPTFQIGEAYRGRIYRKHNHIAIDTGAAFGEAMGCVCLDTDEDFYV